MIFWIVILFLAGAVLIFSEFIVPGLVVGTLGVLCLISSIIVAFVYEPDIALVLALLEFIGIGAVILAGMYVLPRSPVGRALVMKSTQEAAEGFVAAESDLSLMGAQGEVVTALRPAGTILVENRRVSAVSVGQFIDAGVRVRVIEVQGNRVVVEQA